MWYRVAADFVLVVHLLFIGFVVGGVFLAWRWPRVIWVQLPAMVYGALIEFVGLTCPLTPLQNYLQRRAGEAGYSGGFISHYLIQWIYPAGLTRDIQIAPRAVRLPCSSRRSDTGAAHVHWRSGQAHTGVQAAAQATDRRVRLAWPCSASGVAARR